jgi:hypothetical protein
LLRPFVSEFRPYPGGVLRLGRRNGTELSKNGRSLAVVAGSDFAAADFSMGLGDDPMDAGLRDALRTRLSARARN